MKDLKERLQNKDVVMISMMRGSIAAPDWEAAPKIYPEVLQLRRDLIKALEVADAFRCFKEGSNQCKEAEVDFKRLMKEHYYGTQT
jgi:hypothetical protein